MPQFGHVDGQRKKSKTEEDGSYRTLKLAMEMDEKRKARLEKMVANTQAQIGLGDRRRKKSKY